MTFGSLFAGIGGFDLGFERAGMTCSWQVEIDPWCRKVLAKHWPDVRRHDDVKTFPPTCDRCEGRGWISDSYGHRNCGSCHGGPTDWSVDVICGGFPCQDISDAGNKIGITGERSGLWTEYPRIIRMVRPRYVIVENVAALLHRGMGDVLGDLAACGYDAEWCCVPAAAVGAPHIRERVFVVAYPAGIVRDGAATFDNMAGEKPKVDAEPYVFKPGTHCRGVGSWLGDEPGRVVRQPVVGRMGDGLSRRVDRLRGLGNAVVPQVAEWIGRRLMTFASES